MKAKMFSFIAVMCSALVLAFAPTIALAAGVTVPDYVPESFGGVLLTLSSVVGTVAAIDAFVPEEAKKRLPWWLRLIWDVLGGNVFHAKNAGSSSR